MQAGRVPNEWQMAETPPERRTNFSHLQDRCMFLLQAFKKHVGHQVHAGPVLLDEVADQPDSGNLEPVSGKDRGARSGLKHGIGHSGELLRTAEKLKQAFSLILKGKLCERRSS